MPKPVDDPEVEVIPSPEKEEKAPIEVDLEKLEKESDKVGKQIEKKEEKEDKKSDDYVEIDKLKKRQLWLDRQLERVIKQNDALARQNQEFSERLKTIPQKQEKREEELDEIDKLAEKDWKAAVRKLADERATELFKKHQDEYVEAQKKQAKLSELEKSKSTVMARYPNIEDETTEESKFYREVLSQDSSLLSNIHGPEIAMYRMEEHMRSLGKVPKPVKQMVEKEVNRLTRASVSNVTGRPATNGNKITLTAEQQEFCDHNGIRYEDYARQLKALSTKEN